ncbi:MAG: AMP-binding protein [Bacteroidota bacterium]|nr:long-chain fatty acid--CoA ligase [Odoribacter sp.]MDP3641565.1 AMP-binding protein [Bacteroidota bacterium]
MNQEKLIGLFANAFRENWYAPAFSDFQGSTTTYGEAAQVIRQIHCYFRESGIRKGDKIAILGRNSSNWAIAFLAVSGYGAVSVPVLPDFNSEDIHHILNHSESIFLFAADGLFEKLEVSKIPAITGIVSLTNFSVLTFKNREDIKRWNSCFTEEHAGKSNPENFELNEFEAEELSVISYTSGTSGFTKGVMIPARSLLSNIVYAQEHMPLKAEDRIVSFLPMAHVFGLLFEFLFPVSVGSHVTFLTKPPTPQLIVKAFQEVKPNLILSVPLVIEKIYRKRILPALEKPVVKFLLQVPGIQLLLYKKVRASLSETFGGNFHEIVIGGAPLNHEVEAFFRKIKFPFTIGYGMTECGPLISYDTWTSFRPSSAGKLVDRMEVRIDSKDPYNEVGEILVKGTNVMLGYYKNEKATTDVIDSDGWLHTGDLGIIDSDHYIYIRGRCKNMLLGPSGQNIYPEEMEARLNNYPYVLECVITERDGKFVAYVYPDPELIEAENLDESRLKEIMAENCKQVNKELPKYSQLSSIILVDKEFEKTPKRNIRRYLYT